MKIFFINVGKFTHWSVNFLQHRLPSKNVSVEIISRWFEIGLDEFFFESVSFVKSRIIYVKSEDGYKRLTTIVDEV